MLLEEMQIAPKLTKEADSKPIILKLGGSAITMKEKNMTPNLKVIQQLAKEIADADVKRLIIVHGGGSFGHPIARQYGIKEGYKHPSQIEGLSRTHNAMTKLNKLVIDALSHENVSAFPISPASCTITSADRIHSFNYDIVCGLLDLGLVPVLFGDVVLDSMKRFTILSGDQFVANLAIKLKARCIIVGVNVGGLYTSDPESNDDAKLIHHITLNRLKYLLPKIEKAKPTDVTGGMLGKMEALIPAIEASIRTIIVNAVEAGNVYKALLGKKVAGTVITKE